MILSRFRFTYSTYPGIFVFKVNSLKFKQNTFNVVFLLGVSFEFSFKARVGKKGKRSEWLLGTKIRGKLVKASKLSNTDLKENTGTAESGFHSMNGLCFSFGM